MRERFEGLARGVLRAIWAGLRNQPTVEHCGLLLAIPGSAEVTARLEFPGPLAAREFCLPQEWLLRSFLEQRDKGFQVAGFYHTHPEGESLIPSVQDRAGHPPGSLVLLVGKGGWRAYRIKEGCWNSLSLRLV